MQRPRDEINELQVRLDSLAFSALSLAPASWLQLPNSPCSVTASVSATTIIKPSETPPASSLAADESSFTDISTAEITGFEKDSDLPYHRLRASQLQFAPQSAAAPHAPVDLDQVVNSASATYHLDPDLVNSVIHAESGFNSHAVSPKGARGLMQLMPSTASALGVQDAFDPEANVEAEAVICANCWTLQLRSRQSTRRLQRRAASASSSTRGCRHFMRLALTLRASCMTTTARK